MLDRSEIFERSMQSSLPKLPAKLPVGMEDILLASSPYVETITVKVIYEDCTKQMYTELILYFPEIISPYQSDPESQT